MPILRFPKDFRSVAKLSFCYLCGEGIHVQTKADRDHIPPKSIFNARDKEPPLILKTHAKCNEKHSIDDNKMGLLLGLKTGKTPASPKNTALNIVRYPMLDMVAIEGINLEVAVARWVRGFHAALYRQYLPNFKGWLELPFPRGEKIGERIQFRDIPPQHAAFVETIKQNRFQSNVDCIVTNNNKLTYECVWCQFDNSDRWFCTFALDIYGWKDLGSSTEDIPARGCAGFYHLPDFSAPTGAARDLKSKIIIPNYDKLDAFSK